MKRDFRGLPINASSKRQSEEKHSGNNVSNRQLTNWATLSGDQRSKDPQGTGETEKWEVGMSCSMSH